MGNLAKMRKTCTRLLSVAVTLTLLAVLVAKIDWREAVATARTLRLEFLVYSYLVFVACWVSIALRLQALLEPTELQSPSLRLLAANLKAQFYGLFLPADLGAALARWCIVTRNRIGRRFFLFISAMERLMTWTTVLLCGSIALFFVRDPRLDAFRSTALPLLLIAFGLCMAAWLPFFSPFFEWFGWVARRLERPLADSRLAGAVSFQEDIRVLRENKLSVFKALGFHGVFQLLTLLRLALLFVAMNLTLSAADMIWTSMVVLLLATLPLSLAGIGAREAGFVWLLHFYELTPDKGALLGMMLSAQVISAALLGGLLSISRATFRRRSETWPTEEAGAGA